MLTRDEYKEIVEIALDRDLETFDLEGNFYVDYELDSMGAVVLFVEIHRRTGVEIPEDLGPLLQTAAVLDRYLDTGVLPEVLDEQPA